MANEKAIKLYNYTVGITCILLIIFSTIIYGLSITDITLFLILVAANIAIDRFKITVGRVTLTLITIIELSAFLILGIIPSIWIQFITVIITDYLIERKPLRTVLINIAMISASIFAGGVAFNYLSNLTGNPGNVYFSLQGVVAAVGFMFFNLLLNYAFICIHFLLVDKKLIKQVFVNVISWEIVWTLISIPVSLGFTDIYLFSQGNNRLFAVLFLLPVVFISFIFSLVKKLLFANKQLKALSKVSLTINSCLDLNRTNDSIIDTIGSLVSFKGCYIFDINESGDAMVPAAFKVEGLSNPELYRCSINGGILQRITESKNPIVLNEMDMEYGDSCDSCGIFKSCILVPMRRFNKCVGCIGIFSDESYAFNDGIFEFLMILSDQAAIAIENARLFKLTEKESITDGLTNLYNQKYFYNCLEKRISESEQYSKKMSLIMLDIDYFKKINDTYGHTVGDYVLKEIAGHIKSCVRKGDIVSRYGGEEFTVILPGADSNEAFAIAERIRQKIEGYDFMVNGSKLNVTVSGGISEYPRLAANDVEMVNYADRAMYIGAKFKGRNRIKVYEERLA